MKMSWALGAGLLFLGIAPAYAAYTDPDTSFGTNGVAIIAPPASYTSGNTADVVEALSGDLYVLAGFSNATTTNAPYVVRLLSNGSLDTSFGSAGYLAVSGGYLVALAVDDTLGKYYLASSQSVRRFNNDGSLDTGFASGGTFTPPSGLLPAKAILWSLAVLPDGKLSIVATGNAGGSTGPATFYSLQLTTAGSLDTAFGSGGMASAAPTPSGGQSTAGENMYAFRPTYDASRGLVYINGGYFPNGATQTSGPMAATLARFTSVGQPDSNFGSGGLAYYAFNGGGYPSFFVTGLGSDGSVYAEGSSIGSSGEEGIVGYTAAGLLNTGFGNGGILATTGSIASIVSPLGVAAQSDGKILVAGLAQPGGSCHGACVVRLLGDSVLANNTAPSAMPVQTAGGPVTLSSSAGTVSRAEPVAQPTQAPGGYTYPDGFFSYSVSGLNPGATVTVSLQLPAGTNATTYMKCQAGACAPYPSTRISGNTIQLTLTDGGQGDADGVANGVITDPGAPAVAINSGASSSSSSSGSSSGSSSSSSGGASSSSSSSSSGSGSSGSSSGGSSSGSGSGGGGPMAPGLVVLLGAAAWLRRRTGGLK